MAICELKRQYRKDIDILKGLAILGVIFYHIGVAQTGYLGVDVFFVINGFLIIPLICKEVSDGRFNVIQFLKKKIVRLYPVLLVVCAIALFGGYFVMFPDDLNTLAESVIATLAFSNNILSFFLSSDYWDWTNDFKPLMHTWYLGVLVQIYIFISLFAFLIRIKCQNREKFFRYTIYTMGILSLILFLLPSIYKDIKFYFFPFRLFEFCAGGIIGIHCKEISQFMRRRLGEPVRLGMYFFCICIMCFLLSNGILEHTYIVIAVVGITCLCIIVGEGITISKLASPAICIGRASYSFFLWHQVILAFYRLCFSTKFSVDNMLIYWTVLTVIVLISYFMIEKNKYHFCTWKKFLILTALLLFVSFGIWTRAGIVRDIPELEIDKHNIERRKFPHYVDRIYNYNHDYSDYDSDRIKVLLIGNSYARDFANILLESMMNDRMELSYMPGISEQYSEETANRIHNSDYVFCFSEKESLPSYFWDSVSYPENVYGIGTKNFGDCNSIIYNKRFVIDDIHKETAIIEQSYEEQEVTLQEQWGDHYISILSYAKNEDGTVKIFTEDNKFISYDCYHLSPAGARYFAEKIEWDTIFVNDELMGENEE